MKKIILVITMLASQCSLAEVWEGSGALFNLQGKLESTYELTVENTKNEEGVHSKVTITLPDGTVKTNQCLNTHEEEGWKSTCEQGTGGGLCFGEGLCISYLEDVAGNAYSTSIIFDGESDMRLLRTGLKDGKAVNFYREKLHKREVK